MGGFQSNSGQTHLKRWGSDGEELSIDDEDTTPKHLLASELESILVLLPQMKRLPRSIVTILAHFAASDEEFIIFLRNVEGGQVSVNVRSSWVLVHGYGAWENSKRTIDVLQALAEQYGWKEEMLRKHTRLLYTDVQGGSSEHLLGKSLRELRIGEGCVIGLLMSLGLKQFSTEFSLWRKAWQLTANHEYE